MKKIWEWLKKKNSGKINDLEMGIDDESDDEISVRNPIEVAERILALLAVIGKVNQGNDINFEKWLNDNSIRQYLTKQETVFINTDSPKQNVIRDFSWRAEALVSLFWGINLIADMPPLNIEFDVYSIDILTEIVKKPDEFKRNAKLRPDSELKKMENELYDQHWRVRDAQLFKKEMPSELNASIVYERRYGLSWLVGWGDDWDNVPTDT